MFNHNDDWKRAMIEEERKLMRKVAEQRMSWDKVSNIMKLNALMRANSQDWQSYR